ncbi:MAG: Coenzyme F420 hydrogenase/dehydrogenase, beta subunit C-terminal domain [Bacteroidales bacterium]
MIHLIDKKDCVGCNACMQICPKSCIQMKEDFEGFLYPVVDMDLCIDCSLCEKVCPVIHQNPVPEEKPQCFAAKNKNEAVRIQSSSGGVFTLLAESIIEQGGIVFGARFDDSWEVVHDYTETKDGLAAFRGSKYVQSRIEDNFLKVRNFLKADRKVLFSGTPCQVAGLKRFLRKEYENLVCVDFVCHGVPSPKVWKLYKNEILDSVDKNSVLAASKPEFEDIQFRNKTTGWKKYSFEVTIRKANLNTVQRSELSANNLFMRGFLRDLYLRPSCYDCPAKKHKSGADLTIADFWGIQNHYPDFDDDKGVSLIMTLTNKGKEVYSSIANEHNLLKVDYFIALQGNPSIKKSAPINHQKELFFQRLDKSSCSGLISRFTKPTMKSIVRSGVYQIARFIGIVKIFRKIRSCFRIFNFI